MWRRTTYLIILVSYLVGGGEVPPLPQPAIDPFLSLSLYLYLSFSSSSVLSSMRLILFVLFHVVHVFYSLFVCNTLAKSRFKHSTNQNNTKSTPTTIRTATTTETPKQKQPKHRDNQPEKQWKTQATKQIIPRKHFLTIPKDKNGLTLDTWCLNFALDVEREEEASLPPNISQPQKRAETRAPPWTLTKLQNQASQKLGTQILA